MPGPPAEMVFQELRAFVYGDAAACDGCSRVESAAGASVAEGMPPPTFDVSRTLDGAIVANDAFRDACSEVPGLTFAALGGVDGLWLVDVEPVVRIDPFASRVRSGPVCTVCDRPRYVMRSGPICLVDEQHPPSGFSRTDVEFGDSADFGTTRPVRFRPDVLVDRDTGRLLKATGLLGIHLIAQP